LILLKRFFNIASRLKKTAAEVNKDIVRFDSTIVSMSTKLIDIGYNLKGGYAENYRQLKCAVGYSDMPHCICFYKDQTYNSENKALTETILVNQKTATQINVFDRRITSRDNYDRLTDRNISFILRINPGAKQEVHLANTITKTIQTETLTITSGAWVHLFTMHRKRSKHLVRLIESGRKGKNEKIIFITSGGDTKNTEVAAIYKSWWDIEVFFKFIKQRLNFSHLLNRTEMASRQ
jgi:Transposase DDE domain